MAEVAWILDDDGTDVARGMKAIDVLRDQFVDVANTGCERRGLRRTEEVAVLLERGAAAG